MRKLAEMIKKAVIAICENFNLDYSSTEALTEAILAIDQIEECGVIDV